MYGVNTTHTTLKELQPGLEYTVQVVLKMPDGVVGPPSKSERGKLFMCFSAGTCIMKGTKVLTLGAGR